MRSGTKNCYVTINVVTTAPDPDTNLPVPTETLWRNAWANATPRRGREVEIDGQVVAESYIRFDFDYLDVDGITEQHVLVFEGVRYDIKGLLPDLSGKDFYTVDATARRPAAV